MKNKAPKCTKPFDCRVARYESSDDRDDAIHITFYNGMHEIFSTGYIHAEVIEDRLYFIESSYRYLYSIKLSAGKLKFGYKHAKPLYKFEGTYPLKFDFEKACYYISLEDKEPTEYRGVKALGRKINIETRVCDERAVSERETMSTIKRPEIIDNGNRKTSAEKNAEQVVRSALLQLMEEQLLGNKCSEALATLTTLKNYV